MFCIRVWAFVLLLLLVGQTKPFIFELYSIKKSNPAVEGPEWVIGLGDLHDKKHPITQVQKNEIMCFLSSLPKDQVKVMTEDLSSCGSFGRKTCGNFYINSRGGVLGGLTQDCKLRGLATDNHEFRYCRVSSLGPVLNNVQTDLADLGSTAAIKIAALHSEIKNEIDHIRQFNDGVALKKAYDENISSTEKLLGKLRISPDDQTTVAQYLKKNVSKDNRINFVKGLLTFDSELLDCKFVHAIKQESNKKYVIIIAGGAHVKRVCDLLMQDGYTQHTAYSAKDERVFDKKRCAGKELVDGKYCIVPRAIDLSCLPGCCDLRK